MSKAKEFARKWPRMSWTQIALEVQSWFPAGISDDAFDEIMAEFRDAVGPVQVEIVAWAALNRNSEVPRARRRTGIEEDPAHVGRAFWGMNQSIARAELIAEMAR